MKNNKRSRKVNNITAQVISGSDLMWDFEINNSSFMHIYEGGGGGGGIGLIG